MAKSSISLLLNVGLTQVLKDTNSKNNIKRNKSLRSTVHWQSRSIFGAPKRGRSLLEFSVVISMLEMVALYKEGGQR